MEGSRREISRHTFSDDSSQTINTKCYRHKVTVCLSMFLVIVIEIE